MPQNVLIIDQAAVISTFPEYLWSFDKTVSVYVRGKWDFADQLKKLDIKPKILIGEQMIIEGVFDDTDLKSRINFDLNPSEINHELNDLGESLFVLPIQVSIDNGQSYSQLETIDFTTMSTKSIFIVPAPTSLS